jgi:hypothetical protein
MDGCAHLAEQKAEAIVHPARPARYQMTAERLLSTRVGHLRVPSSHLGQRRPPQALSATAPGRVKLRRDGSSMPTDSEPERL